MSSWGHHLARHGLVCDSIGKLHFRDAADDNGFGKEIEPLHVVDGEGDLLGCLREDPPTRDVRAGVMDAGPGESGYLSYDVRNADNAVAWLHRHAADRRPWVLFVGFVCPHPPYIGPPEHFARVIQEGYHIRNGKLSGNRTCPLVCGQAVPGGI